MSNPTTRDPFVPLRRKVEKMEKKIIIITFGVLLVFLSSCQGYNKGCCGQTRPSAATSVVGAMENAIQWMQEPERATSISFARYLGEPEVLRENFVDVYQTSLASLLGKDNPCQFLCLWDSSWQADAGALLFDGAVLFYVYGKAFSETVCKIQLSSEEINQLKFCIAKLSASEFYEPVPIIPFDYSTFCYVFQMDKNIYYAGFTDYDPAHSDEEVFTFFVQTGGVLRDNLAIKRASVLFDMCRRLLDRENVHKSCRPVFLKTRLDSERHGDSEGDLSGGVKGYPPGNASREECFAAGCL